MNFIFSYKKISFILGILNVMPVLCLKVLRKKKKNFKAKWCKICLKFSMPTSNPDGKE